MQKRLIELQLQRGRLLERIANQRHVLAVQTRPVARVMDVGDRVSSFTDQCKLFALQHPLAVTAVVAAVVVLRPGSVMRWTRRGLFAWRTWAGLRSALPGLLARFL